METKILNYTKNDNVGLITFNRPEALNALNSAFFEELSILLDDLEKSELGALVFTGSGKAFIAGADIAEMKEMNPEQAEAFSKRGQSIFNRIEQLAFPVIAAINGFALGGGMEFSMCCDIRLASTKAKLGQPEVGLGLIPGFAGTQRLSRLTSMGNALYLLTTADMINAKEALIMGIVQKLYDPDALMEEALKMAKNIASKGPKSVKLAKSVCREGSQLNFKDACDLEAKKFSSLFIDEGKEGMNAFLEKRKANW